jgi:uncharacterized membrane protein YqhA
MDKLTLRVEKAFERFLWGSRHIVLVAVLASLAGAGVMTYIATVDVVDLLVHLPAYHQAGVDADGRMALRSAVVTHIVEIVDGYLLAAIMLIFSLGLYELFVSDIESAERSKNAPRLLLIRNLDDLKDRLAKVVLLILVVKFFEHALRLKFETPLDLLYLAVGIALLSAALYFSHGKSGHPSGPS